MGYIMLANKILSLFAGLSCLFHTAPDLVARTTFCPCNNEAEKCGEITEYYLDWPNGPPGTQEIAFDPNNPEIYWLTAASHDAIARVTVDGHAKFFAMPTGSAPHGITFDAYGQLWITLDGYGDIVRVNKHGKIVETIDVRINGNNPGPHGLTTSSDGKKLWFTGKDLGTVGKISLRSKKVTQYELPDSSSFPIYIVEGGDHHMWVTELFGNNIAKVSQSGTIEEFPIPTPNSRPIGIVSSPDCKSLWFSEEAGHKLARITFKGEITEFPVPMTQANSILASLAFDFRGNLWTQSYINPSNPFPSGPDYLVRFDKSINKAENGDISQVPITYYEVPNRNSILHRIIQGPDKNIWFTELGADSTGKLINNKVCPECCPK
jgi:virginiamycin B lyase